jgi:hypothetical protein
MLVHDTLYCPGHYHYHCHCHCHCHYHCLYRPQILAGAEEAEKEAAREARRLAKVAKRQQFFAAQKEKRNALKAEKKVRT